MYDLGYLILTWAIPEPIKPPPTMVTFLITAFIAEDVERPRFRTNGRAMVEYGSVVGLSG